MKEIKAFKDALNRASNETAHYMTSQLKSEAHASGWPSHVTRRMKISHTDGSFDVHVHEKHKTELLNLEYGTPDTQPTAAIRRYDNRTHDAQEFFTGRLSRIMGEI